MFDLEENIYIVFVDISMDAIGTGEGRLARGIGARFSKKRGWVVIHGSEALVPGVEGYGLAAHELGHAFGLPHDFQDGSYIMSYGETVQDSTSIDFAPAWSRLSGCSADFLAVHPYLNADSSLESDKARLPTVELISPRTYPRGSERVSMRLEVAASQGLHQAILLAPTKGLGSYEIVACRGLSGGSETVVEFEYDGAIPSSTISSLISSLSDPIAHPIHVQVVDSEGDVAGTDFILAEVSPHQIASLAGHTDEVTSVAFSPDGATLASGSLDGRTILWDVESRGPIATLHDDGVHSISFSPDGALLASGSLDGRITLWNVETREQIAPLEGHTGRVTSVSFSPDGAILASGSRDGRVILWNLETREQIAPLSGHSDEVASVSFSPDGGTLASGSLDRTVMLWDVGSRERLGTLEGHVSGVTSVSFSPDGGTLASGSLDPWDRTIILWDVQTREQITTLAHASGVSSLSFASPGGGTLASASRDGAVFLWDLLTAEEVAAFGLPGEVLSVSFSPGGALLAAGGRDGTLLLWDTSEWTRRRPFELEILSGDGQQGAPGAALGHPLVVEVRDQYGDPLPDAAVTFTVTAGDGKLSGRFTVEQATTDADGRARLILTLGPIEGPNAVGVSIRGLELAAFSAEGVGTTVIGMEGEYRTWHLPEGATARLGKGRLTWGDRGVAHSADGRYLAVGTAIGVWLYDAATSRPLALLPSDGVIYSVAFSLDGTLAAGTYRQIQLWDVETGERTGTLTHSERSQVTGLVFSPDGTFLASGATDHVIQLWDWETKRRIGSWEVEGSGRFLPVAFSPDGARLVAGFDDSTVRLWDVATRKEVATLRGHIGHINSVSFSPDGAFLASAGSFSTASGADDLTIRLWDAATLEEVGTLRGHEDRVMSLAFSRDGATLVSGSLDGTVRLWDVATRRSITTLNHGHRVTTVSFSRDGATLVFGAEDGVWLRDMETGSAALLPGHDTGLNSDSVALSPDGALLAAAHGGSLPIKLWDMKTLELAGTLPLEGHGHFLPVAFSPDGTLLAAGSFVSPRIPLWDVASRRLIGTLEGGQGGGVPEISFSPAGALLASGSGGGAINLWNVETRQLIATLEGHTTRILAMAFSPDGALLASAQFFDGKVMLWDVGAQEPVATLEGSSTSGRAPSSAIAFSPDGVLLASGGWDGANRTVILWDVESRERIATLETDGNSSLAFSHDGSILATPGRQIRLWDVATRQIISTLEHPGGNNLIFAPDGTLISADFDGTIVLWDLRPAPQALDKLSGDEQQGAAGVALAEPLVVEVRGKNGSPWAGAQVTFAVTDGSGTLSATTVTTDADGRASTTLTLGPQAGTNTVEVTVAGLEPVIFTAIGLAVAQSLGKPSGDGQEGAAGAALGETFVVEVRDQSGNPLGGAQVTFAVTSGGGTLSVETATTDADGRAATTLTLGLTPGATTVRATVAGLQPVTFTATGRAVPRTLAKLSGDEQQAAAGAQLAEPLVVSVRDQNGAALPGAVVTFAVLGDGGTLLAAADTTDAEGLAGTTLTLGEELGTYRVVATVAELEPVTFTATAEATPDFNGDGVTDFSDFFLFAEAFGGRDPRFDLDGSGSVDFADFFLFAENFGQPARAKLLAMARERIGLPEGPQLQQNAPNPFNSGTVITWFQLQPGSAHLEVYALTGQRVAVLQEAPRKAGLHRLRWDGRDERGRPLASGVYVYRLVTAEAVQTRKLTLLR